MERGGQSRPALNSRAPGGTKPPLHLLAKTTGERCVLQFELSGPLALKSRLVLQLPADCRKFAQARNAQQVPFGLNPDLLSKEAAFISVETGRHLDVCSPNHRLSKEVTPACMPIR